MSILFYTNYSELSYNFSKSLRKIYSDETIDEIIERNSYWCYMSKKLREIVECYGNKIDWKYNNNQIFYHRISYMYFNKIATSFYAPTSCTRQLQVLFLFLLYTK